MGYTKNEVLFLIRAQFCHCSFCEYKINNFLVDWVEEHKFNTTQDEFVDMKLIINRINAKYHHNLFKYELGRRGTKQIEIIDDWIEYVNNEKWKQSYLQGKMMKECFDSDSWPESDERIQE